MVVPKLVTAKRVHNFTLSPGELEGCTANLSKRFRLDLLSFENSPPFDQNRVAENVKLQFRCADARHHLRTPACFDIFHSPVYVLDLLPQHGNPVIRFLQAQLLLPFQALPHPQKHFEGKLEGHEAQLGSASSRLILSLSETASPAPCSRKRFSSGNIARAWSRTGSLPF